MAAPHKSLKGPDRRLARKRAEHALQNTTALQTRPAAGDCVIETDAEGRISVWSPGAHKLLGYADIEMIGQPITRLLLRERVPRKLLSEPHRGSLTENLQIVRRKDGSEIQVSITLLPVRDGKGDLRGYVATYRHIDEPKRFNGFNAPIAQAQPRPAVTIEHGPAESAPVLNDANMGVRSNHVPVKWDHKVLLATPGAGGTMAAVRHLGSLGFNVGVVSSEPLAACAWSKQASRTYKAPLEREGEQFIDWLMELGSREPGQILLPTSDQTAWLYTLHADKLRTYYRLYQPPVETMRRILDKNIFNEAVVKSGLSVLPSWEPRDMEHLIELAPSLPYPLLIKPRTHVHRIRNDKGLVVNNRAELIEEYQRYCGIESVRAADNPHLPDAGLPIIQQFVDVSKDGVQSISGFIDRTGQMFVTRRCCKVFQRSYPVGVGISFESRPEIPELSEGVRRLCRELGYFGMFEVEFIRFGDSYGAIDFNARMFNQMGLDIGRGMPLPLFACLEAIGDTEGLRREIAKANAFDQDIKTTFSNLFTMRSILFAKTLTGRITAAERSKWYGWIRDNAHNNVDVFGDPKDPMPGIIHKASEVYLGLKAFPKFLRLNPKTEAGINPKPTMKKASL